MNPEMVRVRVWDLPTRLFHWLLMLCVIGSVTSAKLGGNAMVWHFRFGYVIFTLLAFRLLWGFVGGRWSRFASFVYAPAALLRYLKGSSRADEHHEVGHSPLGALSVFALERDIPPCRSGRRMGRGWRLPFVPAPIWKTSIRTFM